MLYSLGERRVELLGSRHFIAHNATLVGSVTLGDEVSIWFNAVLRADNDVITVGARTNVQDGAVLHADPGMPLKLGEGITVGHLAMLHGCTIGDGSLIGIQAVVLNRAVVGRECLVGANTLIPEGKVFPDRSLIVGTPGKVVRALTDEELASLRASADTYVRKIDGYRAGFAPMQR
jgi:carbonic anhydrase/acetyltransferase-like protein (isoleucine patch superfamily)